MTIIDRALKHHPAQVVLTDHNSMTGRTTTLSYRHLKRFSRRVAAALVKVGVLPGKDIVNRGGKNVPEVEVEELPHRHEAVANIAIVAMPGPRLGERGCAFVTLKPHQSLSLEAMKAYLSNSSG